MPEAAGAFPVRRRARLRAVWIATALLLLLGGGALAAAAERAGTASATPAAEGTGPAAAAQSAGSAAAAQDAGPAAAAQDEAPPPPKPKKFHLSVEAKANVRDSQDVRFPLRSAYPGSGDSVSYQETVDPGTHAEISSVSLIADYQASPLFEVHLRFDGVDLYYRNPTTTDHPYDLAELWLRWGREARVATVPQILGMYLKVGKFIRPEAQTDRHLESYGLATTAFERWEDAGVELGADLGEHFLVKVALTQGNPLFLRDPDALAGDTPLLLTNYDLASFNSGIVTFYDTHVETLDFSHPESAGYLGYRLGDETGGTGLELLAWGRRRTLADSVHLPGSPIGGDLAALYNPEDGAPLVPIHGNGKWEAGANLWLYHASGLSLYSQLVAQRVAGLGRTGIESELAWRRELPLRFAARGRQLFSAITPALRYSKLHNDFPNLFPTPDPSLAWDWEKYDAGLRLTLWGGIDLTLEYSLNRIYLTPTLITNAGEGLATLRLRL